jgi:hypothetical protein
VTAPDPRDHPRWCDISGRVLTEEEYAKKLEVYRKVARILAYPAGKAS